jgi:hypothetical protein
MHPRWRLTGEGSKWRSRAWFSMRIGAKRRADNDKSYQLGLLGGQTTTTERLSQVSTMAGGRFGGPPASKHA